MKTESIQDYVGDENCFSRGKHNIPNQYFKCLETGIEMVFTFTIGSGWGVGAPTGQSSLPVLKYYRTTGRKILFPKTPQKYAAQEREFYETMKKLRELGDE